MRRVLHGVLWECTGLVMVWAWSKPGVRAVCCGSILAAGWHSAARFIGCSAVLTTGAWGGIVLQDLIAGLQYSERGGVKLLCLTPAATQRLLNHTPVHMVGVDVVRCVAMFLVCRTSNASHTGHVSVRIVALFVMCLPPTCSWSHRSRFWQLLHVPNHTHVVPQTCALLGAQYVYSV